MVAFTQLSSPVDVTPAIKSSWETVDVTANVSNASGVLLRIYYSAGTSADTVGLRKKGSTDTDTWSNPDSGGGFYCVGIDANDQFEVNVGSGAGVPTVELYGYFDSTDVVFFTNPPRYTGGTGAYADVDISADTGTDTAIGAIIQITNERSITADLAVRPKGSVTDHYDALEAYGAIGAVIIGVDGTELLEAKQSSSFAGSFVKIMGYVKSGITFYNDPTDVSLTTIGAYTSISLPAGADSGLFRTRGAANDSWGIRPSGATFDPYDNLGTGDAFSANVVQGSSTTVEGKISATTMDFFLWGYVDAASGGSTETGTGSMSLGAILVSAAGFRTLKTSSALTMPALQLSGSGTLAGNVTGSGGALLSALLAAGSGSVVGNVIGSGGALLSAILSSGSGVVNRVANGAIALPSIAIASSAVLTRTANGSVVLPALFVTGAGSKATSGTGAVSLPTLLVSGQDAVSRGEEVLMDLWQGYLGDRGHAGTLNDRLVAAYMAQTGTVSGELQDLMSMYFAQQGFTVGTLDDRLAAFLKARYASFTGTTQDVLYKALKTNKFFT